MGQTLPTPIGRNSLCVKTEPEKKVGVRIKAAAIAPDKRNKQGVSNLETKLRSATERQLKHDRG